MPSWTTGQQGEPAPAPAAAAPAAAGNHEGTKVAKFTKVKGATRAATCALTGFVQNAFSSEA